MDRASIKTDSDGHNDECDDEAPFTLEWVFGHDPNVNIINLTDTDSKVIGYATSNICGIYNIDTKKCDYLLGHENQIIGMSHDQTGRFVVTTDKKCVNIWDRRCEDSVSPELLRSMEVPHGKDNLLYTCMSFNGKSIVTFDDKFNLKFWFWSFDNEAADAEITLPENYGIIKSIKFSPNPKECNWFCVTNEKQVNFFQFDKDEQKLLKHHPTGVHKSRTYTDSTYVHNSRRVISITSTGYGVIWSDVLCEPSDVKITNNKNFNKTIELDPSSLNMITSIDETVVIGMESGEIKFFDHDLKFLYFFQAVKFDPIQTVSFNLVPRKFILTNRRSVSRETPILEDGTEVWYRPILPRDATLEKSPFLVRDFIVATKTGKLQLINFAKKQSHFILYKAYHPIMHFDLHPTKPWVCLGNIRSTVFIYHMENKHVLAEFILPPIKLNETDKVTISPPISCISYSHSGNHLFCGLTNGSIWMLDPITLNPVYPQPITFTYSQVDKMKFNDTSSYLAYTDIEFYLNILHSEGGQWHLIGRFREHSRYILAVLWLEVADNQPRLVTVGEDRRLVEYDINLICDIYKKSLEAGDEFIKAIPHDIFKEYTLELSPAILSAIFVPTHLFEDIKTYSKYILITCDVYYKFKIYDGDTFEHLRTVVGPVYESPLITIKFLETEENSFLVFASHKSIGVQILPMDGNPYGRRGMIGSPNKIKTIRLSFDKKYLFTLGEQENSIQMWRINTEPIVADMKVDRPYLEPFCNLLPGGKDGWLFKEIQDFFYYMQILSKGFNTADDMDITDSIPVTEIIDFMRGIGFFPTDYTIQQLMNEATRTFPGEHVITHLPFRTIFKLYVNYRPIVGYKIERIMRVLRALCINDYLNDPEIVPSYQEKTDPNIIPWDELFMTKEELLSVLIEKGEKVEESQALLYLKELLLPSAVLETTESPTANVANIYSLLPNKINIKHILTRLLGMPIDDDYIPVFSKVNDPSEIKPELNNKLNMNLED